LTKRRITERKQRYYKSYKELLKGCDPEYLAEAHFLLMNRIQAQMNKFIWANVCKKYGFKIIGPAVPSDVDDYVYPMMVLVVAAGRVVGVLVRVFLALSGEAKKHSRQNRR